MLTIRTFLSTDADAVHQIFARGQMDFAQGTGLEEEVSRYIQRSLSDDLADIPASYLNRPRSNFWVADLDGSVKGMVAVQQNSPEEAELRRMSVASDARRQGIGRKLLETVDAFCREQGYSQIYLSTVTHLVAAISMYRRDGYQLAGTEQYGKMAVEHYIKHLGL